MLKKLEIFGLEARNDLDMTEAMTEAAMEAMEVTKAPARELGIAGSSSKKN